MGYYAVIFTSRLKRATLAYKAMAYRMEELARTMPGFIGIDSVRDAEGNGITVSYWQSHADISNFKQNIDHLEAQKLGKEKWYSRYSLRVCAVSREYGFQAGKA